MQLSKNLEENIKAAEEILPLHKSYDMIYRNLYLGKTPGYFLAINGFCRTDMMQRLFSDLQNPLFTQNRTIHEIQKYMDSKIGYAQTELTSEWDKIIKNLLSGTSILFIDGFDQAMVIDTRTYPARSIQEPDTEKVIRGARDGFVETIVFNSALIRRRIRSPRLTFQMHTIGSDSKTDVAVGYLDGLIDDGLLTHLNTTLDNLDITSLTMGTKSLEELLVPRSWMHPLPSIFTTERPDVACSYLLEGNIVILVDNSPSVLVLPCTIFQFTQSPEDYYNSPSVGNYMRFVRFGCLFASLFLLPLFLLFGAYLPNLPESLHVISTESIGPFKLFIYVLFIELGLDLFKYSSSHTSSRFSNSLSIVGGLIISDVAIQLRWANLEVIFYGAATMLAGLTLSNLEFADGIRMYRIFLVFCTGLGGTVGFAAGTLLVLLSIITTPSFGYKSYLWPLFPLNWAALKTLLFRYPTSKAQPSRNWNDIS